MEQSRNVGWQQLFFGKFPIWDEIGPKAKDHHGGAEARSYTEKPW